MGKRGEACGCCDRNLINMSVCWIKEENPSAGPGLDDWIELG